MGGRAEAEAAPHPHQAGFRPLVRMQQRGIPQWFLQVLLRHGKTTHDGHGAVLKSVSKATRQRLQRVLSHREYVEAERWFDVYVVVTPDAPVVTTAHLTNAAPIERGR